MLYIIPIIIVFLWFIDYLSKKTKSILGYKRLLIDNNSLYHISVLILIAFYSFKDPFLYPDNLNYYYGFIRNFNGYDTINWGYILLNNIVKVIWNNFYFFSTIVGIIIITSYSIFIKRNSPYIWLSLLLYILINYYPSFFILRQYLAMPFVFLSIYYTLKRKHIKYLVCVILAYSFHTTSLVIFPIYYLYSLKYSRKSITFLILFTIIGCIGFVSLGNAISSYFPMYDHYLNLETENAGINRALMKIYILAVYIYTLGKKSFEYNINKIVLMSMIICVIICVGAVNIYGVYRLRDYYALSDFIGIPIIFNEAYKYKGLKRYYIIIMVLIYVSLLIVSFYNFVISENMNNDYELFWRSK